MPNFKDYQGSGSQGRNGSAQRSNSNHGSRGQGPRGQGPRGQGKAGQGPRGFGPRGQGQRPNSGSGSSARAPRVFGPTSPLGTLVDPVRDRETLGHGQGSAHRAPFGDNQRFDPRREDREQRRFSETPRERGGRDRGYGQERGQGRGHGHEQDRGLNSVAGAQSRAAAAKIVESVNSGMSLTDAFPQYCVGLDPRDQAFVHEIVYGTLRQRRLLMLTLKPMFDYKITERHRIVQSLLLTALYQLVFMRVPAHGVVSATVSACGACGQKSFAPTVNAILRRFLREGATLTSSEDLAVANSFPDWLAERLQAAYGERAAEIMSKSNEKAPLFLRVENSKLSTNDYLKMLQEHEFVGYTCPLSPCAVRLEVPTNVTLLPGFNSGLCTVQDISAQLAAPLLQLEAGKAQRVLDCCCAPGGKTAHILDLNPQAEITALDVDAARLKQTRSTLERLGRLPHTSGASSAATSEQIPTAKVHLQELDAQNLDALSGEFDRILVDAPCSGTGVIRRHPDIKWLRRAKDIPNLVQTQAQILDAAYAKLAKGGILLYTTCSILPEENDEQIKAFLERHSDAQLLPFTINGQEYQTLQRMPGEDEGDGFFYARLQKPL